MAINVAVIVEQMREWAESLASDQSRPNVSGIVSGLRDVAADIERDGGPVCSACGGVADPNDHEATGKCFTCGEDDRLLLEVIEDAIGNAEDDEHAGSEFGRAARLKAIKARLEAKALPAYYSNLVALYNEAPSGSEEEHYLEEALTAAADRLGLDRNVADEAGEDE